MSLPPSGPAPWGSLPVGPPAQASQKEVKNSKEIPRRETNGSHRGIFASGHFLLCAKNQ
jgi:hypothetical protein